MRNKTFLRVITRASVFIKKNPKNLEASAGADNFLFQVRSLPSLITGIVEKTFTHQKARDRNSR